MCYQWLIEDIIVNMNQDSISWFTLDGESKQIVPMMADDCQDLFNTKNIIVCCCRVDCTCHSTMVNTLTGIHINGTLNQISG